MNRRDFRNLVEFLGLLGSILLFSTLWTIFLTGCSIRAVALVETGGATEGKTAIKKEQTGFPPSDSNEISAIVNSLGGLFSSPTPTPTPIPNPSGAPTE